MAAHELTVTGWPALEVTAARRVAEGLARRHGIAVREVFRYTYAGRTAPVAVFDVAGRDFALVPGGSVPLGFDERAWTPSEEEMASFLGDEDALSPGAEPVRSTPFEPEFAAEDLTEIRARLARRTTRPRVAELPALLVAVEAEPAEGGLPAELAEVGARLPGPDEWEHAAAGGARTLFPWGDRFPSSAHPVDPRVPNLFGLRIAHHPDEPELTADPAVVLGARARADGPWFETWLACAPAFRGAAPGGRTVFARPVLPVSLSTVD